MRLLSAIHGPVYGGVHGQALRLAGPLKRRGVDTTVLLPTEPGNAHERLARGGVAVEQLPLHRMRATPDPRVQLRFAAGLVPEIAAVRRLIRRQGIDVVQAHGPTNPHVALAGHLEGIGVVWQIADTRTPVPLRRATMPVVTRVADVITTWGRELGLVHPGTERLDGRWLTVFPPVDDAQFRPDPARRAAARSELGIPDHALALMSVGNRNPQKGHEYLIRAAALVRRSSPEVVVRVLGAHSPVHAAYDRTLREAVAGTGLAEPGALDILDPDDRVHELLPAADVFVLAAVPRSEGIPTVILEAMACGIPVVATDVGAVRELLEDGANGLVVPPEDPAPLAAALQRLAADGSLRGRLGATGRERFLERYSLESLADIHHRAYTLAVEHRARRR